MASQQFCLKWNNHTTNMLQVFESLLSTESFVDVTLACDGLFLKAHRMVLSACSPYFQSLFLENPCKHPIVIMKGMDYKDLKAIIDFMYHGEVNVSQEQLSTLLKTAETLKVKGLAEVSQENRQAGGQEVVSTQRSVDIPIPSSSTSKQLPPRPQQRVDSPPMHSKRKRGRARKRSSSASDNSEDEAGPSKIKETNSSEIEELSEDVSMEETNKNVIRRRSTPNSSVNSFSSKRAHLSSSIHEEPPPSGEEFELEPSKLLVQTLTTDLPSASSSSSRNFGGLEVSQIGINNASSALVPVSSVSESLNSSHMRSESPQDIKPTITFDDSSAAGTSQSMVYVDQSSLPGPSGFDDSSLMQDEGQQQGKKGEVRMKCPIMVVKKQQPARTPAKEINSCINMLARKLKLSPCNLIDLKTAENVAPAFLAIRNQKKKLIWKSCPGETILAAFLVLSV